MARNVSRHKNKEDTMEQTYAVKSKVEEPKAATFKGLIPRRLRDPLLDSPIRTSAQPILV